MQIHVKTYILIITQNTFDKENKYKGRELNIE